MADDPKPPVQPQPPLSQPSPELPESVKARARELGGLGRGVVGGAHIEAARSGQLSPPHSPSNAPDGDQADGFARARLPGERPAADDKAVPSVSDILRDPKRYQPPKPPGHGHGPSRGPRR